MYTEQLTIGDLIVRLNRFDFDAEVYFDFCRAKPTTISSYRGYYDYPALGWVDSGRRGERPTVGQLIEELQAATRKPYEGWKGGTYYYQNSHALFIDNPGCCTSTYLVDVERRWDDAVLITRMADD